MFYYNVGPLLASFIYFTGQFQGCVSRGDRPSIFWTPEGKFDKTTAWLAVANVLIGGAILPLLNINFYLASLAKLNIGMTSVVHASQTFFVALADFLIFGTILRRSQALGMLIILIGASVINIRKGMFSEAEIVEEPVLPIYVPMLFAFIVAIFMAGYIMSIKVISMRVNVRDYTYFVLLTTSVIWLAIGLYYWYSHEGSFSLYFLKIGIFGSIIQVCGNVTLNQAIAKAQAAGPAVAVVSCSMITLAILASLLDGTIPSLMQDLGLLFGVVGALILVIPDQMKRIISNSN